VFQNLREIGNTIALLKDLSEVRRCEKMGIRLVNFGICFQVMDISDTFQFMNVAPFLGLSPEAVDAPAHALETPVGAAFFGMIILGARLCKCTYISCCASGMDFVCGVHVYLGLTP
jgi:hypothetical protein